MTLTIDPFSAFLIGLAGSLHCIGMCGGIVTALRYASTEGNALYINLAYHVGRIVSYSIAGGIVGALGMIVGQQFEHGAHVLQMISGILLVLLGLYISQWWKVLAHLENAGKVLWKRLQPLSRRFLPIQRVDQAFAYGAIWGWLPCGLVYSTLSWSLASGSVAEGSLIMLCFGLGTLPSMLAVSVFTQQLTSLARSVLARSLIGISLILLGIFYILSPIS